ncbi:NmrA family NAD(P)-binding protein [Williamsia sterculiae]|uniref:Nucleoside-diphosphate-sugar epimerase n=1 Tax=Williamsia sterculiae TaxID=1344003 RepID=A0A1N7FWE7_9NOCA|nr:NmrA family NAD(P)-binding protein [Williamsia sterculiae]SIS04650.1 Nucleoside-diphosphate-sugar epimerase [Williamsia sterculiae]
MSKTVLVVGATGNLGSEIVRKLVDRGADVRTLVRKGREDGGERLRDEVTSGSVTVVVGDLNDDVQTLVPHLDGVDVIVSAVQGGHHAVTDGQVNLIHAAEVAGVPRMIPSDFSVDLHCLDYDDNVALDLRKKADETFVGSSVRPTSVLNGGFMEVMFAPFMEIVDLDAGTFSYWGDGEQPMDFTTIPDTAAYTAAAALDDSAIDRTVRVAGDVLTLTQLHTVIEKATGRTLRVHEHGSIAALEAEIDRRKSTATGPGDFVALQYQWAMITGKAKLRDLNNGDYPDITPTSVAEFLATR